MKGVGAIALPHEAATLRPPVDISAPGLVREIAWAPVVGATSAEIDSATLTISPALAEETFPDVPVINADPHRDVIVPEGRSVKTIGLDAVPGTDQRLTLSLPSVRGGFDAPIFASTGVSNGPMAPSSPEKATLSDGLFRLPRAVTAAKLRLSMVTGARIDEFVPVAFSLDKVNLQTATPPRNLQVLGPDNALLWQTPEFPAGSPEAVVDLRIPLEFAFKKSLAHPRATITVTADAPSAAYVSLSAVRGALLRVEEGILTTRLAGAPEELSLALPLAAEQPSQVSGDLTIRYEGLRILETVSDPVPVAMKFAEGPVVGARPALRTFPPQALTGIAPARIGILGRAPEDCEVALEFVSVVGDTAGSPLGPPAVLTLPASDEIALHWAEAPPGLVLPASTGLQARANKGRFFWAASEGRPIVRIAIVDPDPCGRALQMGSSTIAAINGPKHHTPQFSFPAILFQAGRPVLDSVLFLTVEISDLTLRYAR